MGLKKRSSSATPRMMDARTVVADGSAIPVGMQGWWLPSGQFEIPQTTNGKDLGPSAVVYYAPYTLFAAAFPDEMRPPNRTIGIDLHLMAKPTPSDYGLVAPGEYIYFRCESFWDREATILADRYEIGWTTQEGVTTNDFRSADLQRIFCPITHWAKSADGMGSPQADEWPVMTLKFTRYPYAVGSWAFGDFRITAMALPSGGYAFGDKT